MWFTENPGGSVARITPAGVVTEFTVPTANAQPQMIIGASDGNLWFTEFSTTPAPGTARSRRSPPPGRSPSTRTLFAPPPPDDPLGLVDRGDGNIWYVANGSSRVGFQWINAGTAGETSVPTANSGPFGIAAAPDNNLYYTESARRQDRPDHQPVHRAERDQPDDGNRARVDRARTRRQPVVHRDRHR